MHRWCQSGCDFRSLEAQTPLQVCSSGNLKQRVLAKSAECVQLLPISNTHRVSNGVQSSTMQQGPGRATISSIPVARHTANRIPSSVMTGEAGQGRVEHLAPIASSQAEPSAKVSNGVSFDFVLLLSVDRLLLA